MRRSHFSILAALFFLGCNKSPFERTHDASNGGATGTPSHPANFVIFNDELISGGGAFEYPGGENQSLVFNDTSNSVSHRSIRYSWNGQPAAAGSADHTFAGFDLMHTALRDDYLSTPGRNLTAAGYTTVTFYARGTLSSRTDVKIEVADTGEQGTHPQPPCLLLSTSGMDNSPGVACGLGKLTENWNSFTITIAAPSVSLASVKDFFKATFIFTDPIPGAPNQPPGQGGTIFFDVIQYKP